MKPEPLTRKFAGKAIHPYFTKEDTDMYYLRKEVKAAVEWLIKNNKLFTKAWYLNNDSKRELLERRLNENISRAFPDLFEKSNSGDKK